MEYQKQLTDPNIFPDENVLEAVLGNGYFIYRDLLDLFANNDISIEWRYYNDGKMWLCKASKKKKTIVWMSAVKGFIRATIYFPEKYIDGIYSQKISEETKEMIRKAKNIGKSKGCTFEMSNKHVLQEFNEIMQYKLSLK